MSKDTREAKVQRQLAALPREVVPPVDLWPGIESGIANRSDREARGSGDGLARLGELSQALAPSDDLWPAIAARLSPRRPHRLSVTRWPLASLAACAGVTAVVIYALLRQADSDWSGAAAGRGNPVAAASVSAERASSDSVDEWLTASGPEASAVPPAFDETRRIYRQQIAAVRDERRTIEASLARYPDDPELQALWLHVYETELYLIDDAERVLTIIQTG